MQRRLVVKVLGFLPFLTAYLSSCLSRHKDPGGDGTAGSSPTLNPSPPINPNGQGQIIPSPTYDYIVVGSGAGGGPLACNLARAGKKVLLLEAGAADSASDNYAIPAFHTKASEDKSLSWNFYVRHRKDKDPEDSKYVSNQGVLYPRASTLGGCTAHNAMITMAPHNDDWNHIAELTGDTSWRAENMHQYYVRLENCGYLNPREPLAAKRGFKGWLSTEQVSPELLLKDPILLLILKVVALKHGVVSFIDDFLTGRLDPNRMINGQERAIEQEGVFNPPLATRAHRRQGTREYILDTASHPIYGKCLTILTNALVTKLIIEDGSHIRGVEYLHGQALYKADAEYTGSVGDKKTALAREVILAAGAFNTPQILKLSGIGPAEELKALGIPVKVNLPGVGENLQDRYEVSVISEFKEDLQLIKPCTFTPPQDPCYQDYLRGKGPYISNGLAVGISKRSSPSQKSPDLFMFGLPGSFKGYYPGYSKDATTHKNQFTWAILKAHTKNQAGRISLRSTNPQDPPQIDFNYFEDGSDSAQEDLEAVAKGVSFVRSIMRPIGDLTNAKEIHPGASVKSPIDVENFIRKEAWGHHASCSCPMGLASDPKAVVDSRFKVHGTKGLRIVDASIFPRIPGFFIAVPIYMASEKASEVILEDS